MAFASDAHRKWWFANNGGGAGGGAGGGGSDVSFPVLSAADEEKSYQSEGVIGRRSMPQMSDLEKSEFAAYRGEFGKK